VVIAISLSPRNETPPILFSNDLTRSTRLFLLEESRGKMLAVLAVCSTQPTARCTFTFRDGHDIAELADAA
jgi:hypothetical protein